MDWASFFKDYPAVIPAVAGLIGIVLGFVFNGWIASRKRKHELEDRDFARRAAIHDSRIKEAKEYVEIYSTVIKLNGEVVRILRTENTMKKVNQNMELFGQQFLSVPKMMHEASKKSSSIEILDDDELINLRLELFLKLRSPIDRFMSLEEKLNPIVEDDDFDVEEIRKEFDLNEMRDGLYEAEKIITKMQRRLDKLAQTVP